MNTALRCTTTAWLAAMAMVPFGALAQDKSTTEASRVITLDIDGDGKMDRAVLIQDATSGAADLYIYLAVGVGKLDILKKPDFLKPKITTARILQLESNSDGALVIASGCGGCSNDFSTKLSIVFRDRYFLVGGVVYDWDTRNGRGSCEINYLTGKAAVSHGGGKAKPIRGRFTPIKLADWSDHKRPKGCR